MIVYFSSGHRKYINKMSNLILYVVNIVSCNFDESPGYTWYNKMTLRCINNNVHYDFKVFMSMFVFNIKCVLFVSPA